MEMRCILGRSVVLATFYFSFQIDTVCLMCCYGARFSAGTNLHNFNIHTQTVHPCIFPHKTANIQRKCGRRRRCNFLLLFFTSFNYSCACSFQTRTLGCWDAVQSGWCAAYVYMRGRLLFLVFLCDIFDGFIRISMFTFFQSESVL